LSLGSGRETEILSAERHFMRPAAESNFDSKIRRKRGLTWSRPQIVATCIDVSKLKPDEAHANSRQLLDERESTLTKSKKTRMKMYLSVLRRSAEVGGADNLGVGDELLELRRGRLARVDV